MFGCTIDTENGITGFDASFSSNNASHWLAALKKVDCQYISGAGHWSCGSRSYVKLTDLSIDSSYTHYKCTSGTVYTCGTNCYYLPSSACTYDDNNYYTYRVSGSYINRYKCSTFRSGEEYAPLRKKYTGSGQGDYQNVCCE